MALKSKREIERERAKGNEERLPPEKGKSVFFDLLDSFSYTGSSSSSGRGSGRGPCWIPSLSVITNNRKPTTPIPPSTPSSLKRSRPIPFTNKPNKEPRHDLPMEPKNPHNLHHGDISSGVCALNVNKVRKSFYFTNKPNKKPHTSIYFTNKPNKKPHTSIYFTNKPNKKPCHHLPKEAAAAPPPPITAAVKKPRKPHDGDTSSGACAVNVNKVRKSHNLPKAAVALNVNVKTVTVKKKTTQLTVAEKRSEAYRRVPPDFNFKPPRSCHHLIQEDHTFDHWRVLVICMLLNMTTGKQVKKVVQDFFVLCPDAETTTKVDTQQIQNVISTLELHNKRAHMIKRLSEEYLRPDWTHVTSLHGIGKYAADAYAIFCTGKGADVRPQDHKLVAYWNSIYGNDISSDAPM
ncbi:uncharacterized protein LOC144554788 [Carex rostrata]